MKLFPPMYIFNLYNMITYAIFDAGIPIGHDLKVALDIPNCQGEKQSNAMILTIGFFYDQFIVICNL